MTASYRPLFGHPGGDKGDLKGPRHPGHMDVLLPDAPAQQPVLTAGQELGDDELVESGADHADPRALRYQISS